MHLVGDLRGRKLDGRHGLELFSARPGRLGHGSLHVWHQERDPGQKEGKEGGKERCREGG